MNTLWFTLGAIACPLSMLAMGGIAWAATKLRRDGSPADPIEG